MPETETRSTGQRGRPRKTAAAVRKIARPSHEEDERVEASSKTHGKSLKSSEGGKEQKQQEQESADDGDTVDEAADLANDEGDDAEEDDAPEDSNEASDTEEQMETPAFSLATLGLQRVGTVQPPKPKTQKPPILPLNARGMPARIRKRNRLFYDENIINDDKPLRVSLAPKKMSTRGSGDSPSKLLTTPSKVLKKRKGVVSRYMRSNDSASTSNSNSGAEATDKQKKSTPGKQPLRATSPTVGGKGQQQQMPQLAGHLRPGRGATSGTKGAAAAAAAAAAEDAARKAEAQVVANKRLGQSIGLRLRNLLKLPKAHKWAIAEWFYSYIDKPLFDCKYDFMNNVNELAPRLGTRKLNRHEWVNIRRRMGRPRRCSSAFFSEERRELERKRQLMRTLQSCKSGDLKDTLLIADMPEKIPMPLPLGTKVTARLRTPQDGIFAGTVAAYDSLNAMYRVTFERPGLGTQSIPDYEIVSENFHEMLPLHSFTKDFRPNLMSIYQTNNMGYTTSLGYTTNLASSYQNKRLPLGAAAGNVNSSTNNSTTPQKNLINNNAAARNALSMKLNKSDPLLGQDAIGESPIRMQLVRHGYPPKLLEHLVLLQNYIALKEAKIQRLAEMNATAELAMGELMGQDEAVADHNRRQLRDDFQRRYASNIITLERINGDLMYELTRVQELSNSLTRDPNVQAMISPTLLREECRAKASQTVDELNKGVVKSERMIALLKNLTTLLIVIQHLDSDCDAAEVNKVLEGCIEEVRSNLICSANSEVFQKSVQLRLEYIAQDINRNIEERSFSQASVKSPKSLKSELGKTGSGSKRPAADKDRKEKKLGKDAKEKGGKSLLLEESDVEPMDVDSESDDEPNDDRAEQKKANNPDEDGAKADANANVKVKENMDVNVNANVDGNVDENVDSHTDAEADAEGDASDAVEKIDEDEISETEDAENTDDGADDSQITIESAKESEDETQSHDDKDDKDDDKVDEDIIQEVGTGCEESEDELQFEK
ncbi:protein ALWAYS EARLY 2 [Drosophila mojavensis]|uniref:protein ALWAYS EARLY 2 n=1 Tax=Drosophila mojavensis TaxID=7230 RepID=UPI001CD13D2A|nr:protein ALWAYS EARLY 2 [Drosophila mojavensis]